jgi:hypothetical protein
VHRHADGRIRGAEGAANGMSAVPIVPVARSRTVHKSAAIGIVHQRPMRKLGSRTVGITN